jgi:hypothetical protein
MNHSKFRPVCIITVALAATLSSSHYLRAQVAHMNLPRATVHLDVREAFGQKVEPTGLRFVLSNQNSHFRRQGVGLSPIHGVPFGWYTITVWDNGGASGQREVDVNTKDLWVVVGLVMAGGERLCPGMGLAVTGTVRPVPKGNDWWVRVEGVFLHSSKESPISGAGTFSVGGLDVGTYLVEIFEGSKLRYAESLDIHSRQRTTNLTISVQPARGDR